MCGFAGVVVWDEKFRVSAETLKRMSAAIAHRGPDGEGIYISPDGPITPQTPQVALAHRRLAILDPDPRSNQPFTDEGGRWLVFNGEIYNFRGLRAELSRIRPEYAWRTSGDTEVLLVAYSVWGHHVVEHLNGMFAIAIWDQPNQTLFLARDRMGQKPLYVTARDETGSVVQSETSRVLMLDLPRRPTVIAFASELPSLGSLPWFEKKFSPLATAEFLRWGYVPNPLTIYEGANQIAAGTTHLVFHQSKLNSLGSSYFKPTKHFGETQRRVSDSFAVVRTRELVCRAVRRQLVSDVPIGCFLSGGIDSSIVAFAMRLTAGQAVDTFSVGFDDFRYDERSYAREVAEHLGTRHHEFCVRPDAAADLPKLAVASGEPFGDSSALPTYYLSRETRQFVKVALSGDGGDELFGGYDRYRALHLSRRLRWASTTTWKIAYSLSRQFRVGYSKSRGARAIRFLRSMSNSSRHRYPSYMTLFDEDALRLLLMPNEPVASVSDLYSCEPSVTEALLLDRMTYLPDDLLTKVDRASMAWALEVRSPFMDHELVAFAANLRTNQLLDARGGKRMLREAFARDLPPAVFNRPKMGFAVPIGEWFRGELRSMLRDTLLASNSFASTNFNMPVVVKMIEDHESGRVDHSQRLYALLMLELWWNTVRA